MMKLSSFFIALMAIFLMSKAASLDNSVHEYYISESKLTFLQAWTECKIMNKSLINLQDQTSYDSLVQHLKSGQYLNTNTYWLGGVKTTNGAWLWMDTQEYITYSKWATNEPNSTFAADFCLLLGRDYGNIDPYEWEAKECTEMQYYICQ
ncbi:unnamed protein product [Ceutorhynchus assimilis]|uniref:C-type lectin domain-containing protein n=1 Tax=Ceutorhynchus assimilis TaxID=467358 RepID=A0A9N9MLK4_9CUCU|nr:unnamed protein product [Ceutorhynchus assimilis]